MKKSLLYAYFTVGVIFGFGVCMVLRQNAALTISSYAKMLGFVILIPILHWAEDRTHRRHLLRWNEIRPLGRWNFVLFRYLALRGLVVCALFLGPEIISLRLGSLAVFGMIIMIVLGVIGTEEWSDCETQYQIHQLRDAAASIKVLQN